MMKQTCEKIVQYFDYKTMEVLDEYIAERKKVLVALLTRERDINVLRQQQGQLEELNILGKIREHALLTIEGSRNG